MKLTFIGADHEVTGSCHCIEVGDKCILVDYGMEQGANAFENAKLPVEEACVDYVLLTHAHVDHSGMLPLLYAKGFRGQVFTTEASADLCEIMLRDCAHIQAMEAEWKTGNPKEGRIRRWWSRYIPWKMRKGSYSVLCPAVMMKSLIYARV